jgi:hypothetical protein
VYSYSREFSAIGELLIKENTAARHRLTDLQWECIEELFPSPKPTGRPPADCRKAFEAILWIVRTGSPWRNIPGEFGKNLGSGELSTVSTINGTAMERLTLF